MNDLQITVEQMKQGQGTAGLIFSDSAFRQSLYNSAVNGDRGTMRYNQHGEGLKTNFLFRKYYKKIEKEEQANTKASKE